jgi:prolyl oligopeptidase
VKESNPVTKRIKSNRKARRPHHLVITTVISFLGAGAGPPPTPVVEHKETLFGLSVSDPYHWMEAGGPSFDNWLTDQAGYARGSLEAVPGRAALLSEIGKLWESETRVGSVFFVGQSWIYSKLRSGDPVGRIYIRSATDGRERALIDPAVFDSDSGAAQIDYLSVSPDGRFIAYGVSVGGSEVGTLRVRRVENGVDLPETFDRTRYARPNWSDNSSFLYTRLPVGNAGTSLTGGRVFVHRLGQRVETDRAVFGPDFVASVGGNGAFFRGVSSPDSSIVVGEFDTGLTSSPMSLFITSKDKLENGPQWRQISGPNDEIRGIIIHGTDLYLQSAKNHPRQRILRITAANANLATAETVLGEGAASIDGMVAAADALYVRRAEGGVGQLIRIPWGGKPEQITAPFEGAFMGLTANRSEPGVALRIQGWTRSQTVYAYQPSEHRFVDTGIVAPSAVSFDDIAAFMVRVPARDGAAVPVSILAKRGITHDAGHPIIMYAYGAYGATEDPTFNATRRAWFDRGGVYVVVHVRGSGGFGDDWHRAGQLQNKTNSINDFIDTAEYLIRTGWATPERLSCVGVSAGAIVIGGAIVARPDLFSAALIHGGLLNALRLKQLPIGPFNAGEFGSTDTAEGTQMLYAIDAYQQIRNGVAYPGVVISVGRNDTRVSPWMPSKFAARLQAATVGPRPILLRVDDVGGHAGGTKDQIVSRLTDAYAFLLWQAGVSDFQPQR